MLQDYGEQDCSDYFGESRKRGHLKKKKRRNSSHPKTKYYSITPNSVDYVNESDHDFLKETLH